MISETLVKQELRSFVSDTFLVDFGEDVTEDTNLFTSRAIDSFGYIELVSFLESTYKIHISDDELISDSLTSLNEMTSFVQQKIEEG